jgi:hypothetical protein
MQDVGEVEVTLLHPHGPAKSFKYPPVGDVLAVSYHDILTVDHRSTATGRVYTLSQSETNAENVALLARNANI